MGKHFALQEVTRHAPLEVFSLFLIHLIYEFKYSFLRKIKSLKSAIWGAELRLKGAKKADK